MTYIYDIPCYFLRFSNGEATDEELTFLQRRILFKLSWVVMFPGLLRVLLIVI